MVGPSGSASTITGIQDGALSLNGSCYVDYYRVTDNTCARNLNLCPDKKLSVSLWVRTFGENTKSIIDNGGERGNSIGFSFSLVGDYHKFELRFHSPDYTWGHYVLNDRSLVVENTWVHITTTLSEENDLDLYIDGVFVVHITKELRSNNYNAGSVTQHLVLGTKAGDNNRGDKISVMDIDQIQFWFGEKLSAEQVWLNYLQPFVYL